MPHGPSPSEKSCIGVRASHCKYRKRTYMMGIPVLYLRSWFLCSLLRLPQALFQLHLTYPDLPGLRTETERWEESVKQELLYCGPCLDQKWTDQLENNHASGEQAEQAGKSLNLITWEQERVRRTVDGRWSREEIRKLRMRRRDWTGAEDENLKWYNSKWDFMIKLFRF